MSAITLSTLRNMKVQGEKFACLTAYDASFATLFADAGVEVLLVGDSLGMVIQGRSTTLPVTLDEMVYHSANVSRGSNQAFVMSDMPFMADATPEWALSSAARLMKEGGASMVKIEGGAALAETVYRLSVRGVPVCSHLGLLPQSVHKIGGYRVQGRDEEGAAKMIADAQAVVEAGADILLLECVPRELAKRITTQFNTPVIGIGAGPECDGQVLVSYDMLALTSGHKPKFTKDFLATGGSIKGAAEEYVVAVKGGQFPAQEHCF